MSIEQELVRRIGAAERRLETLESRESRGLITDYKWLRGYSTDFFGLSYDTTHHWTPVINGAGSSIALLDGEHGGVLRETAGAGVGRFAQLWLGNAAGGFDTLIANQGYTIQALMDVAGVGAGNFYATIGVRDAARTRLIEVGLNRWNSANNWMIECNDGAASVTDTGIPYDFNPHYHAIQVTASKVEYFLDGMLIATHTTNIPGAAYTLCAEVYAGTADKRRLKLNWIRALPIV